MPEEKPDIIVVMSESFWDPTLLPGTTITPDPMPNVRAVRSGSMFSPEFGGMTANVEFEALTGFSNAFLPYGSIPYQQYVRGPVPSLANFFRSEGYETTAIHPFEGWFWNREHVYDAFGFDRFLIDREAAADGVARAAGLRRCADRRDHQAGRRHRTAVLHLRRQPAGPRPLRAEPLPRRQCAGGFGRQLLDAPVDPLLRRRYRRRRPQPETADGLGRKSATGTR